MDSKDRVVSYTYVSKARREPVKPQGLGERIDELGSVGVGKAHEPQDRPSLDCLTRISVKQPKKKNLAHHRVPGHEPSDFSP